MSKRRSSKEYRAWKEIRQRCLNPNSRIWKWYGGAGVTICPRWLASFENFLTDMGPAPTPLHWLGRRDVQGNYEPGNVLWTTRQEQTRRKRCARLVTLHGVTVTAGEATRLPNQPSSQHTILRRQRYGLLMDNPPVAKLDPRSIWLTHDGQTLPLPEWARRLGVGLATLRARVRRGLRMERVLYPGLLPRRKRPPGTP